MLTWKKRSRKRKKTIVTSCESLRTLVLEKKKEIEAANRVDDLEKVISLAEEAIEANKLRMKYEFLRTEVDS